MKAGSEKSSVLRRILYRLFSSLLVLILIGSSNLSFVNAQEEPTDEPQPTIQEEEIKDIPQPTEEIIQETQVTPTEDDISIIEEGTPTEEPPSTQEIPTQEPTVVEQSNIAPIIEIVEPSTDITIQQGDVLTIRWEDEDPDDNALVSFFLDSDDQPGNGEGEVSIVRNLEEDIDGEGDQYLFNTKDIIPGDYYLRGVISDGINPNGYTSSIIRISILPAIVITDTDEESIKAQTTCSGMPSYGTKMVSASYWEGVDVYSNGNNTTYYESGTYGYKYQCVELVQRFYGSIFGYTPRWGVSSAADMYAKHPKGITAYKNGSSRKPVWGDVIVFSGHVAVVTHWEGKKLYFVEQNWCDANKLGIDYVTVTVKNGKYTLPSRGGQTIKGWLHSSSNNGPKATLSSPSNGTTSIDTLRPTFKWSSVIAATAYNIRFSKKSNMASPFMTKTVTGLSFTPTSDLPRNTKIYWQVKASYSKTWSSVYSFTTPNIPTTPSLSSPANKAKAKHISTIKLDWSNSAFPFSSVLNYYQIQVSSVSNFASTVISTKVVGPTRSYYPIPKLTLSSGRTYYWRVRACTSSNNCGGWSSTRYFITK